MAGGQGRVNFRLQISGRKPPLLEVMIAAAIEAGRAAFAIYRGDFEVQTKSDESPVTAADHAAEQVILARLSQGVPGIPVVAEEQVAAGNIPPEARTFFLVDPVDGTKEFIQKRGDFTVNIALVKDGVPQLGVVYAPAKSRLFAGDVEKREAFRTEQSSESWLISPCKSQLMRQKPFGSAGRPGLTSTRGPSSGSELCLQASKSKASDSADSTRWANPLIAALRPRLRQH